MTLNIDILSVSYLFHCRVQIPYNTRKTSPNFIESNASINHNHEIYVTMISKYRRNANYKNVNYILIDTIIN